MDDNTFGTSQIDTVLGALGAFVLIMMLITMMVNIPTRDADLEKKAEFLIITEWPVESKDDVDTYLQDPTGKLCYYQRREDGLMHLDRDDRGALNDKTKTKTGETVEFEKNEETISIRGIVPGEYICNVHMFAKHAESQPETPVTIKLIKLNPTVKTKHVERLILKENGEELHAFRFTISGDGMITGIHKLDKKFTGGPINIPVQGGDNQ